MWKTEPSNSSMPYYAGTPTEVIEYHCSIGFEEMGTELRS